MKSSTRLGVMTALCLATAACVRLDTPEKKDGYAVGQQIGQGLDKIRDKVDLQRLRKGLSDAAAGTPAMNQGQEQQLLLKLQSGQPGDPGDTGYAVGMAIGNNVKDILEFADLRMIKKGLSDQLAGKDLLSEADMQAALQDLQQRRETVLGAKNKAAGEAYLAKNRALPGVKVTASGLQYQVLRAGHGPRPKATDTVKVNYVGTLIDGTKFDSSYDRHQPAVFELDRVIPGWTEGVQLMPVGSKYRFVIPSDLGYGERGAGGQIGPDEVLVFEVELLGIVKHGH